MMLILYSNAGFQMANFRTFLHPFTHSKAGVAPLAHRAVMSNPDINALYWMEFYLLLLHKKLTFIFLIYQKIYIEIIAEKSSLTFTLGNTLL